MKCILPLLFFFALPALSHGSHWGGVMISEITLKHEEAQVTVKVNGKTSKLEALEVTFGDQTIKLPKEELTGINDVDLRSVRMVTSFGQGNYESRSKLTDTLVIVFEFGPAKYHADEDMERIITVSSFAEFHFGSSKYENRKIKKPVGAYKNKWKLFVKYPGEKEEPDGSEESADTPGL